LALADCQDVLAQSGTRVEELSIIGGGTRSHYWMRLIASALNRRLKLHEGSAFGPAFGAARLARLALTGESPSEVCVKPKISHSIEPDARLAEAYARKLPQFRKLYLALRPLGQG
jgi:xylulokinase